MYFPVKINLVLVGYEGRNKLYLGLYLSKFVLSCIFLERRTLAGPAILILK